MTKRFSAAALAVALMFGGSARHAAIAASEPVRQAQMPQASGVSARRHHLHRNHEVDRPSYPSYYGRPAYYAPAPFFPLPPFFGYGWEPR
jgi:hypothetical protein